MEACFLGLAAATFSAQHDFTETWGRAASAAQGATKRVSGSERRLAAPRVAGGLGGSRTRPFPTVLSGVWTHLSGGSLTR